MQNVLVINSSFSKQILKPIHKIPGEQKMFRTTLTLFLINWVSEKKNCLQTTIFN